MQLNLYQRVATSERLSLLLVILLGGLIALALAALVTFTSPAIAAAAVIALVAGLVVLSNIEFGLYALIGIVVLLPFASIPINLGFNPTLLDLALLAVFVMWLARALTRQDENSLVFSALGLPLLIFTTLAIFSFVYGMSHAGLQIQIVRHFAEVLLALALYFLVINVVRTRQRLERVILALILAGGVSALLGILFYILPHDLTIRLLSLLRVFKYPAGAAVLRFVNDDPQGTLRAVSTSIDPNVLGGLMILVSALTAPQLFAERPLLKRPLMIGLFAAMVLCLFLTQSRGALLGLCAALLVLAFVKYRRVIPLLLLGAIILYVAPFTQNYVQYLIDAFLAADRSTQMRLGEYKDALTLISRYPIFGVGFLGTPDIDTYLGVSSVYLLMAEEMGIVGVAAFLLAMGTYFWQAASHWFGGLMRDPFYAPIVLGVSAALVGSMTAGLFDHYFFNLDFPHSVTLFWLYVGLGMAAIELYREARTNSAQPVK
ncbi:MAG: O-antigen ligase family protein [Anaerolineae bacterium]